MKPMKLPVRVAALALLGAATAVAMLACTDSTNGNVGGNVLPSGNSSSAASQSATATSDNASSGGAASSVVAASSVSAASAGSVAASSVSAASAGSSASSGGGNCVSAVPVTEADFLNACPAPNTCNAFTRTLSKMKADGTRPALP